MGSTIEFNTTVSTDDGIELNVDIGFYYEAEIPSITTLRPECCEQGSSEYIEVHYIHDAHSGLPLIPELEENISEDLEELCSDYLKKLTDEY